MNTYALRVLISNGIAIINFVLLCVSQATVDRSGYLKIKSISMGLMILVYAVMGLWISVFSNIATIFRNLYNARAAKPKLIVNIGICLAAAALCIIGSGDVKRLTWMAVLPLISLLFYSIGIVAVKSRVGIAIIDCIDALLWIGYDFNNLLVMNVLTDLFNIAMGVQHPLMAHLDKKYVFVNRKLLKNGEDTE